MKKWEPCAPTSRTTDHQRNRQSADKTTNTPRTCASSKSMTLQLTQSPSDKPWLKKNLKRKREIYSLLSLAEAGCRSSLKSSVLSLFLKIKVRFTKNYSIWRMTSSRGSKCRWSSRMILTTTWIETSARRIMSSTVTVSCFSTEALLSI